MITVLYFARLRETLGRSSEALALPAEVGDVAALRALLIARGEPWRAALGGEARIRVAVNQVLGDDRAGVKDGDEVAFFPPVTGG